MKVFTDAEVGKAAGIAQVAGDLCAAATSIKGRLQRQLDAAGAAKNVSFVPDGDDPDKPVLDFRLSTSLGQIYARFGLVRDDQMIVGQYAFLLQERDADNKVTHKPIFSMLFNGQSRYVFGDTVGPSEPNSAFEEIDMDFGWRLSGNILLSIYHQLDNVRSNNLDIETLAINPRP